MSVNLTALAVAAGRAIETSRSDALVVDPFAIAFVDASGNPHDLPTTWPESPADASPFQQPLLLGSIYIGVRTRFIDDFIATDPASPQTVVLGAGLDARAFRLLRPVSAVLYELDEDSTLDFKQGVLDKLQATPHGIRRRVSADLGADWVDALLAAGFDADLPTAWIVEGLFPYLSAQAQAFTLDTIVGLSAPGSRAVIERSVALPDGPDLEERLSAFAAQTGLSMQDLLARANPPDPALALESAGWTVQQHGVRELVARYGRVLELQPGSAQPSDDGQSRGGFVTAEL